MWIVAFLHLVALTLNIFIFLPFLAEGVLEFFLFEVTINIYRQFPWHWITQLLKAKKEEFSEDLH